MPFEYRVIGEADVVKAPSVWQLPASRARQYAAALQDVLNTMASDGWELVGTHKEIWSGFGYVIFRCELPQDHGGELHNGIKTAHPGAMK
jgi:hypothetical protein